MRSVVILTVAIIALTFSGANVFAVCDQEPSMPSIFCVNPEIPMAQQITRFEITSLISPINVLWDFGDGNRTSTLATRVVEHVFDFPGRYTVKAWIAHPGGFEGITKQVAIARDEPTFSPTPINSFDENRNRFIDNEEFFKALDMWISNRLRDIPFFEVVDAWIGKTLIVEGAGLDYTQRDALHSFLIYDLNGQRIRSTGCMTNQPRMLSGVMSGQQRSHGSYVIIDRNCVTGVVTKSLVWLR